MKRTAKKRDKGGRFASKAVKPAPEPEQPVIVGPYDAPFVVVAPEEEPGHSWLFWLTAIAIVVLLFVLFAVYV